MKKSSEKPPQALPASQSQINYSTHSQYDERQTVLEYMTNRELDIDGAVQKNTDNHSITKSMFAWQWFKKQQQNKQKIH